MLTCELIRCPFVAFAETVLSFCVSGQCAQCSFPLAFCSNHNLVLLIVSTEVSHTLCHCYSCLHGGCKGSKHCFIKQSYALQKRMIGAIEISSYSDTVSGASLLMGQSVIGEIELLPCCSIDCQSYCYANSPNIFYKPDHLWSNSKIEKKKKNVTQQYRPQLQQKYKC